MEKQDNALKNILKFSKGNECALIRICTWIFGVCLSDYTWPGAWFSIQQSTNARDGMHLFRCVRKKSCK